MQETINVVKTALNENRESIDKLYSEREDLINRISDVQTIIRKKESTQRGLDNDLRALYSNQSESSGIKDSIKANSGCGLSADMPSKNILSDKMKN